MNKSLLLLSLGLGLVSSAFADTTVYRYKDAHGRIVYSDTIPATERGEIEILSGKTMSLKKVTEKQLSKQEIEQRNTQEKEQKNLLENSEIAKQRDQALLANYSSLDDIEKMRSYELQQINRAIQNDSDNLSTLKDRKTELEAKSKNSVGGPSIKNQQELKDLQQNIDNINANLEKNKTLYDNRDKKYSDDKARYTEILKKMASDSSNK